MFMVDNNWMKDQKFPIEKILLLFRHLLSQYDLIEISRLHVS